MAPEPVGYRKRLVGQPGGSDATRREPEASDDGNRVTLPAHILINTRAEGAIKTMGIGKYSITGQWNSYGTDEVR